jgi:inhibitor of the pro-sigma K processing machinery
MAVNYSVILAYAVGVILLFILGRVLLVPLKFVLRLTYNALLGAVCIIAVNFIGGFAGFHIAFNIFTAFIVGFLGIPGFILLVVLKLLFNIA